MLLPVLLLTIYATIFYEMASGAFLQFDGIASFDAAGCTAAWRAALTLCACAHNANWSYPLPNTIVDLI